MEAPEEAMGSNNTTTITTTTITNNNNGDLHSVIVAKGKRTKRQRVILPSTSSAESKSSTSATEEDEDMANCLILLAQGSLLDPPQTEKFTSRRFTEAATTTTGRAGFYVYECKTCNKCFPSFQALGGHRASHKRPKIGPPAAMLIDEGRVQISMNSFAKTTLAPGSNNKARIHECSICGSEFSSGQALGGHMRRHRPTVAPECQEGKKERSFLSLDLNLAPPGEDDNGELRRSSSTGLSLGFADKRPMVVFSSATALVDCHY